MLEGCAETLPRDPVKGWLEQRCMNTKGLDADITSD